MKEKNVQNFINDVATILGSTDVLASENVIDVIQKFVYPKVLKPWQERENHHISDEFMTLMAKHGKTIYNADNTQGNILLEIALQRISRGGVVHKRLPEQGKTLPIWAHIYSAAKDIPAPMSGACFLFLMEQAKYILGNRSPELRNHLITILFGIINNLTEKGEELYANTLDADVNPATLYMLAWQIIRTDINQYDIADELGTPAGILKYNSYFRECWDYLDRTKLAKQLGIKGWFKERKLKKMIFYDIPTYGNMFGF